MVGIGIVPPASRKYAWGVVAVAGVGRLAAFIHYGANNEALPDWSLVVNFAASTAIAFGMLALIALAGFRAK